MVLTKLYFPNSPRPANYEKNEKNQSHQMLSFNFKKFKKMLILDTKRQRFTHVNNYNQHFISNSNKGGLAICKYFYTV